MSKVKLGVIFGGQSTEHEVSIVSGTSVLKNLNKEKYEILPIFISKDGKWYKYIKDINDIEVLEIGREPKELEIIENNINVLKNLDIVFPVLHGRYGEDGTIQGLLELLNIPYVGCKILSSSICMDKIYAKILFKKAGINTAKDIIVNIKNEEYILVDENLNFINKPIRKICQVVEEKLGYPVFVKPSNSGSSVGVNKAKNEEELIKSIEIAKKYDDEILIEETICGRELECAILEFEDDIKASCVGEVLSAEEFYDFDSKYKNTNSKTIIPAELDKDIETKIKENAVKAFKAVKGRGLSRVDFFVSKENSKIYLNEINTMPGFTNISMYPKLWEYEGIPYSELLDILINLEIK